MKLLILRLVYIIVVAVFVLFGPEEIYTLANIANLILFASILMSFFRKSQWYQN